nr:oligosaccharide flippase family protein [Heyndrickxia oleronia]
MNQSFIKSTLILSIATLVSKILGSIFRIPLQNIAGDQVLGIFSLVYPVYMVALTLSVAGIPIAISQLITKARVNHNQTDIRNIFVTAGILAFPIRGN